MAMSSPPLNATVPAPKVPVLPSWPPPVTPTSADRITPHRPPQAGIDGERARHHVSEPPFWLNSSSA